MKKIVIALMLITTMILSCAGCSDDMFNEQIESSTNTRSEKELDAETATIMVYMIGSDLESEGNCATADIEEMCGAKLNKNVKVIIQTGGTKKWGNSAMNNGKVQRFRIVNGKLKKLSTLGSCKDINMCKTNTIANFLTWGMKKYPADRYGVVFWDHGGGSVSGYGYDEYHPNRMISIAGIKDAFKKANAKVNFVGFDACLMGTIETAYAMSGYADYMIASEETEPGSGWDYRNWLTSLAEDPGICMKDLAKVIIGDFVGGEDASFWDDLTLALYDLKDAKKAYKALGQYLKKTRYEIKHNGFDEISDARLQTRGYGDDGFEQIDIRAYMNKAGVDGDELTEALEDMIVFYQGNISDSTGMAMYYPYMFLDYYSDMTKIMDRIGMKNENHRGYFNDFVSILAKGNGMSRSTKATASLATQLTGVATETSSEDYEDEEWYDEDAAEEGFSEDALFQTDEELTFTEEDGEYVLDLTDEQWGSIAKAEMELWIKDEQGYMFFGADSRVDYNKDGDLIGDWDYKWVSINGQFVPFYIIQDIEDGDSWQATGYVPAVLNADTRNEKDIDIYIRWDSEHDDGYVMGYSTYGNDDESIGLARKNYLQFEPGDKLDFYCDCYTLDGKYDDSYYVGDTLKVGEEGLTVEYDVLDEDEKNVEFGYHLVDKYGNEFWTEVLGY